MYPDRERINEDTKCTELIDQPSLAVFRHIVAGNPLIKALYIQRYSLHWNTVDASASTFPMERDAVLQPDCLEREIESLKPDENILICSKVETEKGVRYLSQVDLSIEPGDSTSLSEVYGQLQSRKVLELSGTGYLLFSGNSYHFIGTRLLTRDEYVEFLGRFLTTSYRYRREGGSTGVQRFVDDVFVGYSLVFDRGLRVSAHGPGKVIPYVVKEFTTNEAPEILV